MSSLLSDVRVSSVTPDTNTLARAAQHIFDRYDFGSGIHVVSQDPWLLFHRVTGNQISVRRALTTSATQGELLEMVGLSAWVNEFNDALSLAELKQRSSIFFSVTFNDLGGIDRAPNARAIFQFSLHRASKSFGKCDDSVIDEAQELVLGSLLSEVDGAMSVAMRK